MYFNRIKCTRIVKIKIKLSLINNIIQKTINI